MRRIDVVRLADAAGLSLRAPFEPAFSYSNAMWSGALSFCAWVTHGPHGRCGTSAGCPIGVQSRSLTLPSWQRDGTARCCGSRFGACRVWLGRLWPSLSDAHRRHRISQLAAAMRQLHRVPMPPKWQRPDLSKPALARRRSPVSDAALYQQPRCWDCAGLQGLGATETQRVGRHRRGYAPVPCRTSASAQVTVASRSC